MAQESSPALIQAGTRVLVCGGGGFICSHLIPRLLSAGVELRVQELEEFAGGLRDRGVELIAGHLEEPATREAIAAFDPEVVFNLAGRTDQSHSRANDDAQATEHYGAARALARAVFPGDRETSLKRWVQTGTNEEYGHNPIPHIEGMREMPVSAYSVSKLAATHHVLMLHRTQGCPAVVVRPFVVYGPGQKRGLVPFAVRAALEDKAFETSEGTQCRDFVFVDDVVEGFFEAGRTPGVDGEIFNLGSGIETPVRELIETCCRLAGGGRPSFGALPIREGEILRMQASVEKADERLGWRPRVGLEEGLGRMIESFRAAGASA